MGLPYTSFYFTCNVEYTGSNETVDDGARFDVAFLFNDVELTNITATDLNASSLSVRIDPKNFKYNFGKVVCFVDCKGYSIFLYNNARFDRLSITLLLHLS